MTASALVTRANRSRPGRRIALAALLLGIVAIPSLLAGAHVDAPVGGEEIERVAAALHGSGGPAASDVARQYFLATVIPEPAEMPTETDGVASLMARARLAQVLFLFAISGGVYLATLLARGRVQALLACLLLPMLPPVGVEGHVLRPETPSTLFGLLALVLLQCLSQAIHRRAAGRPKVHCLVLWGYCAAAGVALALALVALPSRGVGLFLPGIVMTVAALQIGARVLPILRRRGVIALPMPAINRRLWPWTIASLLAPTIGLLLLVSTVHAAVDALPPSRSSWTLLPAGWLPHGVFFGLFGIGVLAAIVRIGLRFGRRGRVGPDLVLLAYGAMQLASSVATAGNDALPAAPAMAIACSEGVYGTVLLLGWWRLRRQVTSAGASELR